jgi:hypothetical protein
MNNPYLTYSRAELINLAETYNIDIYLDIEAEHQETEDHTHLVKMPATTYIQYILDKDDIDTIFANELIHWHEDGYYNIYIDTPSYDLWPYDGKYSNADNYYYYLLEDYEDKQLYNLIKDYITDPTDQTRTALEHQQLIYALNDYELEWDCVMTKDETYYRRYDATHTLGNAVRWKLLNEDGEDYLDKNETYDGITPDHPNYSIYAALMDTYDGEQALQDPDFANFIKAIDDRRPLMRNIPPEEVRQLFQGWTIDDWYPQVLLEPFP